MNNKEREEKHEKVLLPTDRERRMEIRTVITNVGAYIEREMQEWNLKP